MDDRPETGRGGAGLLAAVAFCLLAIGGGVWVFLRDGANAPPMVAAIPPQGSIPEPETPAPETGLADAPSPATTAPTFDEIRRDPDGTTVIAGRAAPGSTVSVQMDGKEVANTIAGSDGGFAVISSLPPGALAQVMTLQADGAGRSVVSEEEILLAPALIAPQDTSAPPITMAAGTDRADTPPGASVPPGTLAGADTVPEENAGSDTQADASPAISGQDDPGRLAQAPSAPLLNSDKTPQPAQIAILRSDAQGVTLLPPSPPGAMTQVAIDMIGYSEGGAVQLSGRAQARATEVRVYLDNEAVVSLPVNDQGQWRGDLPDVDEGVYTLRVDEVTADGTVSSRVETPFQRESDAVLAEAARATSGKISAITVQKGATLWAIARDRYGDGLLYVKVFEANDDAIRDPDLIYPGQVFSLPD